jgi:hypothetical protein
MTCTDGRSHLWPMARRHFAGQTAIASQLFQKSSYSIAVWTGIDIGTRVQRVGPPPRVAPAQTSTKTSPTGRIRPLWNPVTLPGFIGAHLACTNRFCKDCDRPMLQTKVAVGAGGTATLWGALWTQHAYQWSHWDHYRTPGWLNRLRPPPRCARLPLGGQLCKLQPHPAESGKVGRDGTETGRGNK